MSKFVSLGAAAVLAVLMAGAAIAQQPAPYRMDPNAPLDFKADEGDAFDPTSCTSTLRGRVELVQDKTRVRTRELRAFHRRQDDCKGLITRWEAKGDVFYVTPAQRIRSDAAIYDDTAETATFTGNVVAVQGDDVTTGETLVVDLKTSAFKVGGGPGGRIRGVIVPKKK